MSNYKEDLQLNEWIDSIESVIKYDSSERAKFLLENVFDKYIETVNNNEINLRKVNYDYVNTIPVKRQIDYPGDKNIEYTIYRYLRWNALMIVLEANSNKNNLGGHISTYASISLLYEVGFNHFWKSNQNGKFQGDLIFFQGHSSPGIYARSFLEGRISDDQLLNFRSEVQGKGLSSYPHPWLMPEYWQFPTVSMGLGPIMAINQAKFMKYLTDRKLMDDNKRKVWCFIGDGETSEVETLGNINIATRENLNNLIFVVNCNLQRLDGPVHGNGKIIQELESNFLGVGWKVIKCIWGSGWDKLIDKDVSGKLIEIFNKTIDGEYQAYRSKNGEFIRKNFFGKTPETMDLVKDMTDQEIWKLKRGGHDIDKIYNAFYEAVNNNEGKPVVVLVKTIKGYELGGEGESKNITHNTKKLSFESLKKLKDFYSLPIDDETLMKSPLIKLDKNSKEYKYLIDRRNELGGFLPNRTYKNVSLSMPKLEEFNNIINASSDKASSNTMGFVKILNILIKDKNIGKLITPIIPDESRTFGMEGMFRQYGIWSHIGQLYNPEDSSQLMYYKEDKEGQLFQEGINEHGAMSLWIAAATSYVNHGIPIIPFYIYYSIFGFQRVGDLAWAAGDIRARGFLIGGTSGRTTLSGEGLQHNDGQSHIQAGLIPNCITYDPTFNYEIAVIILHGMYEMYNLNKDVFYYLTLTNENYLHPVMPENVSDGIIKGSYLYKKYSTHNNIGVNLLGSGAILNEVIAAAQILLEKFNINSNVFSCTSFNELYKDGISASRYNLLNPTKSKKNSYINSLLTATQCELTVAATDYVREYANKIREFVPGKYIVLGTDGFGRSDHRENLRKFFEVDKFYITIAVLSGLYEAGKISLQLLTSALSEFNIDTNKLNPWEV